MRCLLQLSCDRIAVKDGVLGRAMAFVAWPSRAQYTAFFRHGNAGTQNTETIGPLDDYERDNAARSRSVSALSKRSGLVLVAIAMCCLSVDFGVRVTPRVEGRDWGR
ncbi:hypothetical protein SKAU_G00001180 [Synaphobranchus kaupii]|uniref:Uncharacterized protein n=1 Tax=Synaphobranchus kaupii TaxID=118154 RepID=A0A9Q1G892_SYNKA|nr:hypothetical protein SKAU_G00001180 [Synaphobranchus kaupii]